MYLGYYIDRDHAAFSRNRGEDRVLQLMFVLYVLDVQPSLMVCTKSCIREMLVRVGLWEPYKL